MSKKHFIHLAELVRCANLNEPGRFSDSAIRLLADWCASENSRFNRDRWLAFIRGECGPNGGRPRRAKQMLAVTT